MNLDAVLGVHLVREDVQQDAVVLAKPSTYRHPRTDTDVLRLEHRLDPLHLHSRDVLTNEEVSGSTNHDKVHPPLIDTKVYQLIALC